MEAFTYLCQADTIWWRWGDNPCTEYDHDPEEAYTTGWSCMTTADGGSVGAFPEWGYWHDPGATTSEEENTTNKD